MLSFILDSFCVLFCVDRQRVLEFWSHISHSFLKFKWNLGWIAWLWLPHLLSIMCAADFCAVVISLGVLIIIWWISEFESQQTKVVLGKDFGNYLDVAWLWPKFSRFHQLWLGNKKDIPISNKLVDWSLISFAGTLLNLISWSLVTFFAISDIDCHVLRTWKKGTRIILWWRPSSMNAVNLYWIRVWLHIFK